MYSTHSHITSTPNVGLGNSEKKILCIIRSYILEFVPAKFDLNLVFVQLLSVRIDKKI